MERQAVNSSALKSIGYDAENEILEVEFLEYGEVWQYLDVTPSTFKEFLNADSLGRYFVKQIKGKYRERRVRQ